MYTQLICGGVLALVSVLIVPVLGSVVVVVAGMRVVIPVSRHSASLELVDGTQSQSSV